MTRLAILNGDYHGMLAMVTLVPRKGRALVATGPVAAGTTVAYYKVKMFRRSRFGPSTYKIRCKIPGHVFDVGTKSFDAPDDDGIPNIAQFANEPTFNEETENCTLVMDTTPTKTIRTNGGYARHALVTTKALSGGTELVWDYGPGYTRDYASKYTPSFMANR